VVEEVIESVSVESLKGLIRQEIKKVERDLMTPGRRTALEIRAEREVVLQEAERDLILLEESTLIEAEDLSNQKIAESLAEIVEEAKIAEEKIREEKAEM